MFSLFCYCNWIYQWINSCVPTSGIESAKSREVPIARLCYICLPGAYKIATVPIALPGGFKSCQLEKELCLVLSFICLLMLLSTLSVFQDDFNFFFFLKHLFIVFTHFSIVKFAFICKSFLLLHHICHIFHNLSLVICFWSEAIF